VPADQEQVGHPTLGCWIVRAVSSNAPLAEVEIDDPEAGPTFTDIQGNGPARQPVTAASVPIASDSGCGLDANAFTAAAEGLRLIAAGEPELEHPGGSGRALTAPSGQRELR